MSTPADEKKISITVEMILKFEKDDAISTLASLFFTPREIAAFLKLDPDDLHRRIIHLPTSSESIAYRYGQMTALVNTRISEYNSAVSHSSSAAEFILKYSSIQKEAENE